VDAHDLTHLLRRFAWARLIVALALLAGALLAHAMAPAVDLATFAAGLGLTLASSTALLIQRSALPHPRRGAWALLGLDVATATIIVVATGGPESIFAFLYVLVVIASCVLLSRTGALVIAGASSLLYVAIVLGGTVFPVSRGLAPVTETTALSVLTMFMNTGTFLVVAITAGSLAEQYRSVHHALEDQRKDLSDVQAFRDLIFQSVGTGLITLDLGGRITAYNRAAEDMTGVPASHAVGRPWHAIFPDAIAIDEVVAAVRGDARARIRHECAVQRLGGPDAPVAMTFWALRSGTGQPVGLIAVCEDLSSLRELEARMRQADRLAAVGRMAANIAHEIRNPLASLTGAIEVLARDVEAGSTRQRLAQIVTSESERLDHIIKDLLDYARPAPLTLQSMNLADTLDEVLLLLEHRPLPEHVKIIRAYEGALPAAADPQQIRQVFWNLCLNAVEAMPKGGELRVSARADDRRVDVSISDTGAGIPAADLGQIFEPFFSTKSEGNGIGLALVHRIVQEHGGEIDVKSDVGEGTTFTITLPATDA
jgi:two-component system sensor histidine kinase PilS (NtrC family)